MREAEILSSGELMVDGQKIGQVEAFRLTTAGENAEVLQEAKTEITSALEAEYERRTERFVAAPNGDISIAQDGYVRWLGQTIAKLNAGENILDPEFVLLADEDINQDTRDRITQRLQRFISFHFETELKPLYDLRAAEALFEKPRFVALKLVENLGIVPRRKIAAEVKALEQESRAALRRLGVRFGVYHIFIPSLLKPAPAQALTLLWALQNNAQDKPGYGDVVSYLLAGRTSFAVEDAFDKNFYGLAGYRVLGTRAVRIDMLERCADLIRQATSWKPEEAETPRPDGAYDGRQFTITQAMLSILGTTPENMEEILKQLGYVAEPIKQAEYQAHIDKVSPKLESESEKTEVAADVQSEGQSATLAETTSQSQSLEDKQSVEHDNVHQEANLNEIASAKTVDAAETVEETTVLETETKETTAEGKSEESEEEAVVLLWHYQKRFYKKPFNKDKRSNNDYRANGNRAGAGSQNASSRPSQHGKGFNDKKHNAAKNGHKNNGGAARKLDNKKQNKPVNVEDSPFAALAALKGKLKK